MLRHAPVSINPKIITKIQKTLNTLNHIDNPITLDNHTRKQFHHTPLCNDDDITNLAPFTWTENINHIQRRLYAL